MSKHQFGEVLRLARSHARATAMQALYQWQMTGQSLTLIEIQFLDDNWLDNSLEQQVDVAQRADFLELFRKNFIELFRGVPTNLTVIDETLSEFVDRPVDSVDPVERAILRLGVYEFQHHLETPYRVILNEGINLAKEFGADGSHRYVNGILDKVAQKLRHIEIKAKQDKTTK